MSWANPALLWLLLLVPLCAVGVVMAWRRRAATIARFAHVAAFAALATEGVHRARAWQSALAVVGVGGLALAAAGPRLGHDWQTQPMQGITLVVVLDVSRSMDAADTPPSRMEQARRELGDLVAQLRGDAIGLVIFASGSHVRIPPTVDYDTFLWAARDSASDTLEAQGTHLAGALDGATQLLSRAKGSGKAILVVSDGEDHGSTVHLDEALARARDAGIRVYALGVGTPEGAPIPLQGGGFKKDRTGEVVVSRLEEGTLQRLAAATGGAYVRSVPSDDDVRKLYEDEIRGKLEVGLRGVRRERLWHERYQWPLAVGVVALAVSALLGIGRARVAGRVRDAAAMLLVLVMVGDVGRALAGAAEDGASAWRAKRWDEAVRLLGQARVEDAHDPSSNWMLGDALLHVGRHAEAEQVFRDLAERDPSHRAQHLYNAGHAAHRGGRLDQAAKDFEEAGKLDPALGVAKKNLDAVRREIAARRQQQGPSDAPPGGQGAPGSSSEAGSPSPPGQGDGTPTAGDDSGKGKRGTPPGASERQGAGESRPGDVRDATDGIDAPEAEGGRPSGDGGVREPAGDAADAPGGEGAGTLDDEGAAAVGEGGDVREGASGTMSPEAAARLVEAVPDGRPRVVVHGETSEEDW